MDLNVFDVQKFNIIQDEENYYFFRALEPGDNSDIEQQIIISETGKIERIRTDRERYNGETKYKEDSEISLEEIYDHIKMHYRKDTNCISFTTNANVAINYGRESFEDSYIMIKIPKKEFGEKTVVAGQYMLQELYSRIQQSMEKLPEEEKQEILSVFDDIEDATENKTLQDIIAKRYTVKPGEVNSSKAHLRKGITYSSPKARISSYQALDEEQLLEVNKIYAKLAILENENILNHVIPHSSNSKLRETIGNAFSSTEIIHYGDIRKEYILEIPKEVVDIFALVQQVNGIDENKLEELKQALIKAVQSGIRIPSIPEINLQVKSNISIEEMYELTEGKVEYGKVNSIVKNMFYLSKSRQNAIALSNVLTQILGNNSKFEDIIQHIRKNGFRVEPEIISRKSGRGVKLSESVNLNLSKEEQPLVDEVRKLSSEELDMVLQNGGLYNVQDIITRTFSNVRENEEIDKSRYYAEAIMAQYNWQDIGIEEFKIAEKNEFISRLQGKNCVEIYQKLREYGIEESQIPTVFLNIVMRESFYEQYKEGDLEELLNTRQDVLQNNINIEVVERFLGYYDVENTGIKLTKYQQRAMDNIDRIFEDKKFAQVILPTGAGKSYIALEQMRKYVNEHPNEKILYLAPQDEILNQIKSKIIKHLHGKQETVGKSEDEIIAEVFPNITFETYSGLLAKRGQEVIEEQYGMIVLDELHRTGAKEWEGKIDTLFENQTDEVKVLGITATPTRDVDGRNMANETAKKLGYTEEEVKQEKHLASNMTLKKAIRMGYVVNPKLVYCKYDLISSGKMDELRAKIDDIEDEAKRSEELQKYNELRQKLNKEIDEEIGEEARKKLEEDARKNLDSGIGKEEILRQNVKKGGKYIVFIPVTDQGDIEDESGNRIGTKTGEDKIKAYQDYLNKVFEGTDIIPQCHAMSGNWNGKEKNREGQDKNQQELNAFEADNSEKTKFMVVMNKANEGLHIDGIDGIIWFRALDENSRILYLQQLGRAIYALDEDNPLPDDKRPTVIDLVNNSLTVNIEKEFENVHPIDDLEELTIVIEWINEHDGMLPNANSSNRQEQHYYAVLRRIQNKYNTYLDGFDNFDDLTEDDETRIKKIIDLAIGIDLWDIDLPPISKSRESKGEFDPFTIEGVLRDFVEFEDEIDKFIPRGKSLKKALEIENWCKLNYGDKEIWNRELPNTNSNDEKEKKLAFGLRNLRTKIKQYKGKELEEVENEEDRKILEIVRRLDKEYGLSTLLKNALEIENWCKVNYEDKEIWNRELPKTTSKDETEKRLAYALHNIRKRLKQYKGKIWEEIENEEDRRILEIIGRLDEEYGLSDSLKNALELENWCKLNYGDKEKWNRNLPRQQSDDEEEKRLGSALNNLRQKLKIYEGKELEEVENKEDRRILEIIRRLDEEYGLSNSLKNALEIENWCKVNYEDKEKWNRRLPSAKSKNEEEKRLGTALHALRKKLKKYEGIKMEKVENEEDRRILEIIRRLDEEYGLSDSLKNALEIENWCKVNCEDKEIWNRELPKTTSKDEIEKRLAQALGTLRTKIKPYEGKKIEEVENEEDRRILEIIRRLDKEYGLSGSLKNALEIENWCKVNYGDKEIWNRKFPSQTSKDEEEKRLARALGALRTKIKKYEGKKIEEVENEEDRRILEIVKRLDKEYGLSDSLKNVLEIENWCKLNYGDKEIWDRKLPSPTSKDEEEKRLGKALVNLRKKVKQYEGKEIEEVENEEDRKILEILRRLDEEYGLSESLKNVLKIENWCKLNYGDKEIWDRKLPNSMSKDKEEKRLGNALHSLRKKLKQYEGKEIEEVENEEDRKILEILRRLDEEYNPKKAKQQALQQAKIKRDEARHQNNQAKQLELQVSEQLEKRGKNHEEQ